MIDSGAGPSLIKLNALDDNVSLNTDKILNLTGINPYVVKTLGYLRINFLNYSTIFHVVPNNFPIDEDGILGMTFLKTAEAKANWKEDCLEIDTRKIPFVTRNTVYLIPKRSRTVLNVKLEKTELNEGFIENIQLHKELFLGNAIVRNIDNHAKIIAINTSQDNLEIKLPPLQLLEIEKIQTKHLTLKLTI